VARGGASIVDYMRARAGSLRDIGELERTVLALRAAGVSARSFGGRDLVAAISRQRSANGSWKGNNGWTAFGVLALKASGGSGVGRSAHWLARQQNRDGGFGFRPQAVSDVDDTGAVLQALGAAGLRRSSAARRAVAFLRSAQNGDGGFAQMRGGSSNAQSTAWAVQGIVASGRRAGSLSRHGRTPLTYLRSLQSADGSVRYSRSSGQTPVWVTAQVLDAYEGAAFPIAPVARAAPRSDGGGNSGNKGGTGGGGGSPKPRPHPKPHPAAKPPAASVPAPTTSPAPAPPNGPTGPTGSSGPVASPQPPPLTSAQRAAMSFMRGGGGDGAWVAAALIAGVVALSGWRLARRRRA
jgi:energy-coupling factor transport system substrate-specific component